MLKEITVNDKMHKGYKMKKYPKHKLPISRKLSTNSVIMLGCLTLIILIFGIFWSTKKYTNKFQYLISKNTNTLTPSTNSGNLEWQLFKDENVEYKYPKIWFQSNQIANQLQSLIEISDSCKPIIFRDQNNKEVILLVENYPQPLQKYSPSCWSKGLISKSNPNSRPIKINGKEHRIEILQLSSNSSTFILERYGFESDFTNTNAYMFSIIFPQQSKDNVEPILDEIIISFKYLKQYQVAVPKDWKTYTSMLGFSFEYPSDWGEVIENINDAKTQGSGDSGKTYSLTFSIKSNVSFNYDAYGAGQSYDYSAGRGSVFSDYKGDPKKSAFISSEITLGLENICYQYPIQYVSYKGVIRFNLPGKEINGVMLVVPILSSEDIEKYGKLVIEFINNEESCNNYNGQVSPRTAAKEKEIINMLNNGVNFDKESQINLDIFKRISKSAKLL